MNANSKPLAPTTIKLWLERATNALSTTSISSAQLDASLLLADALGKDRTWLLAHSDENIPVSVLEDLESNLTRRINREPLAYIRGYKEFYGRDFALTPDTLIPRPETEAIIGLLAPLVADGQRLIDVGTGSGAIAITAKLEYQGLIVEAVDVSKAALAIAQQNAKTLDADITIYQSDLLNECDNTYDIICANLPYVDAAWQVSEETHYEPDVALYAKDDGLALIKLLIEQSAGALASSGYLFLEADPRQHDAIVAFGHSHDFDWYETEGFIIVLQKRS